MANIGLRNAKYNEIDYTTKKYKTLSDSLVPVLGKLIDAKFSENRSDVSLFADDTLEEYNNTFTYGTINLTVSDVDDETYARVKGCTINESEVSESEDDISPELGYGHIITKMINGVRKYKVEFLPRVRITKINSDAKTKGENVEFNTVSVEGKVMALKENINGIEAGKWRKIKTFNNLDDAKEYLDGLLTPVE